MLVALVLAVGAPLAAFHPAFLAGADFLVDALVAADEGDFALAGGEDVVVEVVGFVLFFDGSAIVSLSLSLCGHTSINRYLGDEITKNRRNQKTIDNVEPEKHDSPSNEKYAS